TQIVAVAAFLRVINALENIRQAVELLRDRLATPPPRREDPRDLLTRARAETNDAVRVLTGAGLHPQAVLPLQNALRLIDRGITAYTSDSIQEAVRSLEQARADLSN
ncbi:MAG: hypothetical protein ACRD1Q_05870, partial [Vicinamibacterales bacterium]